MEVLSTCDLCAYFHSILSYLLSAAKELVVVVILLTTGVLSFHVQQKRFVIFDLKNKKKCKKPVKYFGGKN